MVYLDEFGRARSRMLRFGSDLKWVYDFGCYDGFDCCVLADTSALGDSSSDCTEAGCDWDIRDGVFVSWLGLREREVADDDRSTAAGAIRAYVLLDINYSKSSSSRRRGVKSPQNLPLTFYRRSARIGSRFRHCWHVLLPYPKTSDG